MSTEQNMATPKKQQAPGSGKQERYIQPSVLLALHIRPSYGYELIRKMQDFGFIQGEAPPGMIYRHLRQLEEDGLVVSEWETDGTGPAKRMYVLTDDGRDVLELWIDYMERVAEKLNRFAGIYRRTEAAE